MNDMNHERYVKEKRREIVKTAEKIIKKEIDTIEGCRKISVLWFVAELPDDKSCDFFELIDSDTDTFPRGNLREISSEKYLKEHDQKEKVYLEHFEKDINEECQGLIEKYGSLVGDEL